MSTKPVTINIGGGVFSTSMETMTKEIFFARLMEPSDANDVPFVDRDPTHFRYILNYLRGSTVLPSDKHTLTELREEARFYSLTELEAHISTLLKTSVDAKTQMVHSLESISRGLNQIR